MLLTHISLTDFRNYARLDIEVPHGPLMLVGGNAQGKTSLMEAIYYLATFASFQASHDRQLVNFHANREPVAVAKIFARFNRTEEKHIILDFDIKTGHHLEKDACDFIDKLDSYQ